MDRPKVPVRHSSKKAYFVALRCAWFMFEPVMYAAFKAALKKDGLTDAEIEASESPGAAAKPALPPRAGCVRPVRLTDRFFDRGPTVQQDCMEESQQRAS
jgi:hypothetical protein